MKRQCMAVAQHGGVLCIVTIFVVLQQNDMMIRVLMQQKISKAV